MEPGRCFDLLYCGSVLHDDEEHFDVDVGKMCVCVCVLSDTAEFPRPTIIFSTVKYGER